MKKVESIVCATFPAARLKTKDDMLKTSSYFKHSSERLLVLGGEHLLGESEMPELIPNLMCAQYSTAS